MTPVLFFKGIACPLGNLLENVFALTFQNFVEVKAESFQIRPKKPGDYILVDASSELKIGWEDGKSLLEPPSKAWVWTSLNHGRCSSFNRAEPCRASSEAHGISWTQFPSSGFAKTFVYLLLFYKTWFFDTHWCLTRPGSLHNPSRLWVGRLRTHGTLDSDHFPSLQMVGLSSPHQLSTHIHFWLVPIARNVTRPPGLVLLVFEPFRLP